MVVETELVRIGMHVRFDRTGSIRMPDQVDDAATASKLIRPAMAAESNSSLPPMPTFLRPPAQPSPIPSSPRPAPNGSLEGREHAIEPRKLIVGPGITVSGEIASCDAIVIEGSVRANMQGCEHMTIAATGLFDGNALITDAEVHGRFAGDLTVRNRLWIRTTGQVSGTVSYGQIEIETGGRIAGSIQPSRT